jgi:hypothetical protein
MKDCSGPKVDLEAKCLNPTTIGLSHFLILQSVLSRLLTSMAKFTRTYSRKWLLITVLNGLPSFKLLIKLGLHLAVLITQPETHSNWPLKTADLRKIKASHAS